jgi:ribosome-binding factor A
MIEGLVRIRDEEGLMVMAEGARPERVAEEFREILAEEIPRLKDPRIGFVTLTHVDVSPDLRRATVYYTVLGEDRDHKRTRAGLISARTHLRTALGHQVRMRFTPELDFQEDVGITQVARVTELLKQIESESKPKPGAQAEAEASAAASDDPVLGLRAEAGGE